MISIFSVIILYPILSVVVFGGWALSIPNLKDFPLRTLCFSLFINFLFNAVLSSWFLFVGLDFITLYASHLLLGVGGWVFYLAKKKSTQDTSSNRHTELSIKFVAITTALVIGLYAAPKIHEVKEAGVTYRLGPDLIGYGIAVGAITEFKNIKEIEKDYAQLHDPELTVPARELSIESVQRRSSIQSVVSIGFLLRDYRSTLTILSEAVHLTGLSFVWAIIIGLSTISAALAGLVIQFLVFQKTKNNLRSMGAALMAVASATVLNGFHEGGVIQVLSLPAIALAVFAIFSDEISARSRTIYAAISAALLFPTYSSPITTLVPIALICLAFSTVLKSNLVKKRVIEVLFGSVLGALIVLPHFYRYLKYLPQAIADGNYAGWTLPRWMTPVEMVGFVDAYDQKVGGYVNRSTILLVFLVIANGVLLFSIGRRVVWKIASLESQILISVSIMILMIYLKTRYVDLGKNYQLFKGVGYLLPFISVSLFCLDRPARAGNILGKHNRERTFAKQEIYAFTMTALVIAGSVSFVGSYLQKHEYIPGSETEVSLEAKVQLDNSNIVAPDDHRTWQLGSRLRLDLYSRAPFGVVPPISARAKLPLYLLIWQYDCPQWKCINKSSFFEDVSSSNQFPIVKVNEVVMAFPLASSSDILYKLIKDKIDPLTWFSTVSEITNLLYGFNLDERYRPIDK